jgi:hypothetical protein
VVDLVAGRREVAGGAGNWREVRTMKVLVRLLVLALVVMAGVAAALDIEDSRQLLKGLKGVHVVVEELKADVEQSGLTKTAIQADVELQLRQAGIPVLSLDEYLKTPGHPYLHINLSGSLRDVLYVYSFRVELRQVVRLYRDLSIFCYGIPTWGVGSVGRVGQENMPRVRDYIKDDVDKFISAYLSVNPK